MTTFESWDGGGHTTETEANHTIWYESVTNSDDLPKSYTFGSEKQTIDDTNQYKGVLYNWLVATAGKGIHSTPLATTIEDSICPRGWRLPIDSATHKSWQNLLNFAGTDDDLSAWIATAKTYPYSLVRSGVYHPTEGNVATNNGFYWSASTGLVTEGRAIALQLYANDTNLALRQAATFGYGRTVRCVSR